MEPLSITIADTDLGFVRLCWTSGRKVAHSLSSVNKTARERGNIGPNQTRPQSETCCLKRTSLTMSCAKNPDTSVHSKMLYPCLIDTHGFACTLCRCIPISQIYFCEKLK